MDKICVGHGRERGNGCRGRGWWGMWSVGEKQAWRGQKEAWEKGEMGREDDSVFEGKKEKRKESTFSLWRLASQ